jgi:hypothetical protein
MWSILWNLWWWGQETKVVDELNFCWATDTIEKCKTNSILHMAGVTEDMKNRCFYKGDYIEKNPIESFRNDNSHFDYIDKDSATIKYLSEIKKVV